MNRSWNPVYLETKDRSSVITSLLELEGLTGESVDVTQPISALLVQHNKLELLLAQSFEDFSPEEA